jgi:hypothetical protein
MHHGELSEGKDITDLVLRRELLRWQRIRYIEKVGEHGEDEKWLPRV